MQIIDIVSAPAGNGFNIKRIAFVIVTKYVNLVISSDFWRIIAYYFG
jgi:hypothetical protein